MVKRSFKKCLRLIAFAGLLPGAVCAQDEAALELSLGEAFARAEQANLQALIGRETVESAKHEVTRSRANLLPSLDLNATQNRSQTALQGAFTEISGSSGDVPSRFRTNDFDAKLDLKVPLVQPVDIANYTVSKLERDVSELQYRSNLQSIYEEIARAYIAHLRNLARLEVIAANIDRDSVLLDLARNQVDAGVATPIDAARAEVSLARHEQDRLQQETVVESSRLELLELLNMNLDTSLELEELPLNETALHSMSLDDIDEVIENRPEYEEAQRTLERNQQARKAASWERFPSLNLTGQWGYTTETVDGMWKGEEQEEWYIGVSLSMPIFEGFRIRANKLQADSLIRQQEYRISDLENEISASYRLALQDLKSRFAQIAVARKAVDLSERELNLARSRFREGVADNRDVVEAQANLAGSSDNLVDAIYQYNLARLQLARVRGDVRLLLAQ